MCADVGLVWRVVKMTSAETWSPPQELCPPWFLVLIWNEDVFRLDRGASAKSTVSTMLWFYPTVNHKFINRMVRWKKSNRFGLCFYNLRILHILTVFIRLRLALFVRSVSLWGRRWVKNHCLISSSFAFVSELWLCFLFSMSLPLSSVCEVWNCSIMFSLIPGR